MRVVDIHLKHPENVRTLVNITNQYPYTILLRQGRYVVDAKSVLGICTLQRTEPVKLEAYSDDCNRLMEQLRPLIV